MQDLRYALRNLRKARAFTLVAVLTLAIGVGANTAIFSIIDTILLRSLPFHNPDQLVRLYETESAPGTYPFAGPDLADWRAQNHTFHDMAMYGWIHDLNASREGRADHLQGVPTEVNFFDVLGVRPILGRTWIQGEGQPGKERVVVLSAEPVAVISSPFVRADLFGQRSEQSINSGIDCAQVPDAFERPQDGRVVAAIIELANCCRAPPRLVKNTRRRPLSNPATILILNARQQVGYALADRVAERLRSQGIVYAR